MPDIHQIASVSVKRGLCGLLGWSGTTDKISSDADILRTQQLQSGANPTLVSRTLGYDSVGNLTSLVDQVNSETLGFSYDEQDRLTGGSGPAVDTYTYTTIGNINSKNGTSYNYDANHPHAVSNSGTFLYDANGNMRTRGSQAIKYDPENRPIRVDANGGIVARFAYDGDGTPRKRLHAKGVIHYVGAYEMNAKHSSQPKTKEVSRPMTPG